MLKHRYYTSQYGFFVDNSSISFRASVGGQTITGYTHHHIAQGVPQPSIGHEISGHLARSALHRNCAYGNCRPLNSPLTIKTMYMYMYMYIHVYPPTRKLVIDKVFSKVHFINYKDYMLLPIWARRNPCSINELFVNITRKI